MKKAFTLIELLVVIAIIAILAAILFPVFAQAKNAAKGAASLSNVKQLATASLMYSGDADDQFVAQYVDQVTYGWQQSWIMLSLPYIKSYGIFKDPNDNVQIKKDTGPKYSYVANGLLAAGCNANNNPYWQFRGVIGFNGDPNYGASNWYQNGTRSQTQINEIAGTVLFASRSATPKGSAHDPAASGGTQMEGAFSPWEAVFQGPANSDYTSAGGVLPGQKAINAAPDRTYLGYIDRFYAGNSPVAFTDGHAKSGKPETTVDIGGGIADGNAGQCYDKRYLNQWDALR